MSLSPIFQYGINSAVTLALVAGLTACGGASGGKASNQNAGVSALSSSSTAIIKDKLLSNNEPVQSSLVAPSAQIMFPTPTSMTERDYVLVRGTASDMAVGVLGVSVNGVEAITVDNYANWQASVPLTLGENTLTVSVTNKQNVTASAAATASIQRMPSFKTPHSVALDGVNNRAIIVDTLNDALVSMDLQTGISTPIFNKGTGANKHAFVGPNGIALDLASNRALVLDRDLKAVIAVDLTSGTHTIISSNSISNASNALVSPNGIALDTLRNRVLVADRSLGAIIAVDLTSGVRTVLSDKSKPAADNALSWPEDLALDAANNRVLVVDSSLKAVVAVDLLTGARTLLSSDTKPDAVNALKVPQSIVLDVANNRALVLDLASNASLVAINLSTGARTNVSGYGWPDYSNMLDASNSLVLDAVRNRALILDTNLKAIVAVDLISGVRTLFGRGSHQDISSAFSQPDGLAYDSLHNRILVVDIDLKAIVALDLTSGARTIFSSANIPNAVNPLLSPREIALDLVNNRALITDGNTANSAAVIAVDLTTGARTILSSNSIPDATNPLSNIQDIALDRSRNRALVLDSYLDSVVAVDLTSGARTILSVPTSSDSRPLLSSPQKIAIDFANSRALLTDFATPGVVSVDLNTGVVSQLSSHSSISEYPDGVAIDTNKNRALLVHSYMSNSITTMDLTTHSGSSIYNYPNFVADNNYYLPQPSDLVFDAAHNIAFVVDQELKAVMVIDLLSGEMVCFSK